jgi:lipoprotein NlpD
MDAASRNERILGFKTTRFRSYIFPLVFWISNAITLALLPGCASPHHAPIMERAPDSVKTVSLAKQPKAKEADWRPDIYVVKKGDTLYSIALEHGLDYRELAERNNISDPNVIMIDRRLRIKPLQQTQTASLKTVTENLVSGAAEGMLKTQPKPIKQPYGEQVALQAEKPPADKSDKPVQAPPPEPRNGVLADDDEQVDWSWPTKGKVLAGFSDNQNAKGIDISGKIGQPVYAVASGKVVYSGNGLRGYGKLIIIKHNKTFLSAYAHNNQILVKEGQSVVKGYKIAEMGDSDTDEAKLHFEIRRLGQPVDPLKYLPSVSE